MLCVCVCVVWDTGPGPELSGPGLPAASLRHLSEASILLATRDKTDRLQVRAHTTPPYTNTSPNQSLIHIYMSTYWLSQGFSLLLVVWEKSRQQNERCRPNTSNRESNLTYLYCLHRLLRPRLGSPDALEELLSLDKLENQRSQDFKDNVVLFRSQLVRSQVNRLKLFCEDLSTASRSHTYKHIYIHTVHTYITCDGFDVTISSL